MQNRWLTLGLIVVAVFISGVAIAAAPSAAPATGPKPAVAGPPVIEVDSLMKAPEKYPGIIRVQGMVRKLYPKEQRLGLLDALFMNCCSTPCDSEKLLPVKWTGDMPRVRALVLATGEARKTGGTFEFVATSLETVKTPASVAK